MLFKVLLGIVVLLCTLLVMSGTIPQLSMLSPIRVFVFSILKLLFSILRATWPLLIIAACGYFFIKSRK